MRPPDMAAVAGSDVEKTDNATAAAKAMGLICFNRTGSGCSLRFWVLGPSTLDSLSGVAHTADRGNFDGWLRESLLRKKDDLVVPRVADIEAGANPALS